MLTEKTFHIYRLNKARSPIEVLLASIPTDKDIYPDWTIKEYLAHMTGWDDAVIAALEAHASGREPGTPARRGIDNYNAETVSTRESLDYEHVRQEWQKTREALVETIKSMPDEKFYEPLIFPWGEKGSIAYLIDIFVDHEEEHFEHLQRWLEHPEQPLVGAH